MASSEHPPPAYPDMFPSPAVIHKDSEFVICRFRFPASSGVGGGTVCPTVKIFAEDSVLDDISPVLGKMFPRGRVKLNRQEHMVRVELGYQAVEYGHMQIFKMISARGFIMRTSHSSGFVGEKIVSYTYTFAR